MSCMVGSCLVMAPQPRGSGVDLAFMVIMKRMVGVVHMARTTYTCTVRTVHTVRTVRMVRTVLGLL